MQLVSFDIEIRVLKLSAFTEGEGLTWRRMALLKITHELQYRSLALPH